MRRNRQTGAAPSVMNSVFSARSCVKVRASDILKPERCEVDAGFVNQVLDVASVKVRQKCDAVLDVGSCRQVGWQLADKMNVGS